MKTSVSLPIGENNVVFFFGTAGAFGVFLIYTQNFILGLLGLHIVLISMHETGHIWALKLKGYKVEGLILSVFGPGLYKDKPTAEEDSTFIYFAGFLSLIFPICLYIIWPNLFVFVYLSISASALSVIDLHAWWTLRKDAELGSRPVT